MRILPLFALLLLSCTENSSARSHGGSMNVALPCDEKLFDLTWKEVNFWYATRPMRDDERPESYVFREKSGYGIYEGTVNIKECESPQRKAARAENPSGVPLEEDDVALLIRRLQATVEAEEKAAAKKGDPAVILPNAK